MEYDLFGMEAAHYHPMEFIDMPNDGQRVQWIKALCKEGYSNKILVGHDLWAKNMLVW